MISSVAKSPNGDPRKARKVNRTDVDNIEVVGQTTEPSLQTHVSPTL